MSEEEKKLDSRLQKIIESGELKYDYIKSNYFRVVHVDGVWGGVTPQLNIQMAVFNERSAIPKQTVQEIKADGSIGRALPEKTIARDALVREVEVDLIMNLQTAKKVIAWLQDKVDQIEALVSEQAQKTKKEQKHSNV
jgi:hypothetical protein